MHGIVFRIYSKKQLNNFYRIESKNSKDKGLNVSFWENVLWYTWHSLFAILIVFIVHNKLSMNQKA
jgi:hypothetical protein